MDTQKLYAILDPVTGHVKMGRSINPQVRLREIEISEGKQNLKILIVSETASAYDSEAELHNRFSEYRVVGEWFNLSPELLAELESVYDALRQHGNPTKTYKPNTVKRAGTLKWKLPELLAREGVTAYRLHKELGNMGVTAAPNTVYRWAKELPAYVTVEHLEGVISALRRLTGKHITVCDLMEVEDA